MQLLHRELPPDHDLIVWGDTHYGSKACSESTLNDIVDRIVRGGKRTFTIHTGDAIEGKTSDSPHFSHEVHDASKTPNVQMNEWCDIVRKIKPAQWLALHFGNHEYKHWRYGNLTKDAADKIGAPYGGFTAKHVVRNAKTGLPMHRILSTHGKIRCHSSSPDPHVRRKIMEGQIKRGLSVLGHADCVLSCCGHNHKLVVVRPVPEPYLMDDGDKITGHYTEASHSEGRIDESLRYYATCGTQHRTVILDAHTYSELSGYGVSEMGYVLVEVRGGVIKTVEEVRMGHC